MIAALAPLVLRLSPIGRMLKRVPRFVWVALAIAVLLFAGFKLHQREAGEAIAAAEKRGADASDMRWQGQLAAARLEAAQWRAQAEDRQRRINQQLKERHDEKVRANAALADALRVRGPGAAAARCRPLDPASLSAAAGGRRQAAPAADAAGPPMPAADGLAVVPWEWLVRRAEQFDELLSEAMTWRRSDAQQRAEREKQRLEQE
jgi:hypothetical protein